MVIKFSLPFRTVWGQKLFVYGSLPELGNWQTFEAKEMQYTSDGIWQLQIELAPNVSRIDYRYLLVENDQVILEEWERGHSVLLDPKAKAFLLNDSWEAQPNNLPFYSSAFTKAIFRHEPASERTERQPDRKLIIKVFAPVVKSNQYVAITGGPPALGCWQPERALRMSGEAGSEWQLTLDASALASPFGYKFLVMDTGSSQLQYWETGDNRVLSVAEPGENETVVVSGLFFRENVSKEKYAGTVIPVFSLRSESSFGVGDFGDLRKLVDWVKSTGQRLIQLLPVNDTTITHTWTDSYPYSAISNYALHPIYLDLNQLGPLKDKDDQAFYEQKRQELNESKTVEYEAVLKEKLAYAHAYYKQKGKTILKSDAFEQFYLKNVDWLVPYAAFCFLRDTNHTADFSTWGEYAVYNKVSVHSICDELSECYPEIAFTYFLQFMLHRQFQAASDYARANNIVLKGDLPIGINRFSVDAWAEPQYFNLHAQAGAPPDDFSVNGQNWSFPTYRWDNMERDQYSWWKKRLAKMGTCFDAFRIDHILGFFRIWEIPTEYVEGLCGHFRPALPLTRKEIEKFGFNLNEPLHTTAHINEAYLAEIFGEKARAVADAYLERVTSQFFALKPFCNTQRKIEKLFEGIADEESKLIKTGLFTIANEVLFLRDPYEKEKFHPRISGNHSYMYRDLFSADQYAFDQLYWDFFYHRHNDFWKAEAYKRLTPMLSATDMLVCGEDLGMIPDSVHEVMTRMHILSLELERMPKTSGREFADLRSLPYLSVCTTSTHDMNPLRAWWKEDREKTQRYYNQVLGRGGEAPAECSGELAGQIVKNHLEAPSMFVILPLQDWLAMDEAVRNPDAEAERINIPANPKHYWRCRMHLTIEALMKSNDFNEGVRGLIGQSGRME